MNAMKYFSKLSVLLVFCLVASCSQRAINPEITNNELYTHIDFLASDSLMGRLPGTPFDRVAAKYIKDYMEISGFELLGKNGYQFFEYIDHQDIGIANSFSVNSKPKVLGSDYSVLSFSSSDSLASTVVFVGYGFSVQSDRAVWNDYIPINITGQWAMILRGDPDYENSDSPFANYSDDRKLLSCGIK